MVQNAAELCRWKWGSRTCDQPTLPGSEFCANKTHQARTVKAADERHVTTAGGIEATPAELIDEAIEALEAGNPNDRIKVLEEELATVRKQAVALDRLRAAREALL